MSTPLGILIVEDDAKFRESFAEVIRGAPDMRLLEAAANGQQCLAALARLRPDVLLVDLDLPDMRGLDIIRQVARSHPDCEVMVVTVFGDERHVIESIEAGATGYLLKDSLPQDLLAQIRQIKAGGSPISPIIARRLLTRFQPENASSSQSADKPADEAEVPALSERERSVLNLVTKGYSYDEIASLLSVSRHTVLTYVKRIYRKLQVTSKTEAVYEARKMGLVRD